MASTEPDPAPPGDASTSSARRDRLDAMSPRQRRRLYVWAIVRPVLTATLLVVGYFLLPLDHLGQDGWLLIVAGVVVIALVLVWQIREILSAQFPMLQAVEALAAVLPLYLLFFAGVYVVMSNNSPGSFSEALSHVDGIYFSVVVFSTVGFGDITPHAEAARVVVTFQILGDLALLAFGLRLVVAAVKRGQDRLRTEPGPR